MVRIQLKLFLMLVAVTGCIICSAASLKAVSLKHRLSKLRLHQKAGRSIVVLGWGSCDFSKPLIFSIRAASFEGNLNHGASAVSLKLVGNSSSGFTIGQAVSTIRYPLLTLVNRIQRESPALELAAGSFMYSVQLDIPSDALFGNYVVNLKLFDANFDPLQCVQIRARLA